MSDEIPNAYVQTFEDNIRHIAQQKETKLKGTVDLVHTSSKNHNWELLGSLTATVKSTRLQATPLSDAEFDRRVSLAQTINIGESSELEDPVQMLVDPNSNLVRAMAMGMNRGCDDIIIDAATADALNGDASTTAFNYTTQATGDYTTAITFDKVAAVQRIFMENDIMPDVPKVAVVSPGDVETLMKLTEQTSADYVKREALQQLTATGICLNWMGFTWIVSNLLNDGGDTGGSAANHDALFYTDRALGLAMNKDITIEMAKDPTRSFAWILYAHSTLGAIRVEDKEIVVCKNLN